MMRTTMVAVMALVGAMGCSQGEKLGGGKDGAAQAMAQATAPLTRSPSDVNVDVFNLGLAVEVKGSKSGSVTVRYGAVSAVSNTGVEMGVTYKNFSDDGRNFYDGPLTVKASAQAGPQLVGAELSIVGKLNISGEVSDFIDVEVLERVAVTDTSVGVTLSGKVRTSEDSYDYAGENMSFGIDIALPTKDPSVK